MSCLKDAAKHRWGAEMTTQGPFTLLSDRKKGKMGFNRLDVAFMTNTDRDVLVFERTAHNLSKKT